MKKTLLALGTLALAAGSASAALSAGSLAFTGYNGDGNDDLAWVALEAIPANQVIFFSDNNWNGTAWSGTETFYTYTAPAGGIAAGTVVQLNNVDNVPIALSATIGSLTATSANFGLNATDEIVYAYIGTAANAAPTAFLGAITVGTFGSSQGSLINTGLTEGSTAQRITPASTDVASYIGARSGATSFSEYLTNLNTISNFLVAAGSGDQNTSANGYPFSNEAFTIIPAPATLALAGLGAIVTGRRRR